MGLLNTTVNKTSRQSNPHLAAATAEEYFPYAEVPILDDDLLDEGYFEPDGVNDFVRDAEAWDPDREF